MKKIYLLFVFLLSSIGMSAQTFEVDGIKYYVKSATDLTVEVTGYNSNYEGNLILNGTVVYNDVTYQIVSIQNSAFQNCSSLTSVGDLSSCTSIGTYAFCACSNLTTVGDLSSCTSIGHNAFQSCSSLTNVDDLGTSIGAKAFYDCHSLTTVGDLSSCISIGNNAFQNCSCLTSVGDLSSCTSIGQNAFNGCSSLTSVGELSACTSIGTDAFNGISCPFITITSPAIPTITGSIANASTILVPQDMIDNYRSADGWKDLTYVLPIGTQTEYEVTISAQDASSALHAAIGENNLQGVVKLKVSGSFNSYDVMIMRNKMINLRYLDLSDATIVANDYEYYSGCHSEDNIIGNNMFRDLKLISVKLPQNITKIGDYAFYNCTVMKEVEIHEGLKLLGQRAFYGCSSLAEISLPDGMEDIGGTQFVGCPIKEITIPEGITRLREQTFSAGQDCILERIHLPSTLEVIEGQCFCWMGLKNNLTELILPAGLKRIEGTLSKNTTATSVHIPPMVEYIADNAFSGWTAVTDYYVYVVDPIDVNMNTFANYTTSTLHVPTQSYYNYYWNTQWSQFANLTEFDEPYESFYLNNDFTLAEDKRFDGVPNAIFKKNSGFIVEGNDSQNLDEVHVISDGTDAASIIDDGNISVNNLYYDITIVANRWYFFSFPFRVKCSDIVAPGYYALRYYDGEERANNGSGGWKDYTGEYLEPGVGYIFQCNTAGTLSVPASNPVFDGEDKDCSLTMYRSDNDQHASWNFIGNPCSSYYNIDDCGYDAPLTIWNGSGYDAYRPGDDEYLLHPFQAFFTQKPEDSSSLQFESDSRCTYQQGQKQQSNAKATRMMKGINPDRLFINLTLSDGANSDRTRVVFNDKKADAYELGTDAAKFLTSSIPQIYSIDGTKVRYAINERPQGEVKLGFNAPKTGTYTIAAVRMDMPMLLRDLETNTTVSLTDKDYTFESKAGSFDDRFVLTVDNSATGIAQLQKETGTSVIGADNGLYISGISDTSATIYNTSGAIVAQNVGNGFMPLATGIYIVKVNGKSAKVAVR
ncbi:MAG: leucine-rich repeat domain-containing protein [Prevotella sp.]|nr:leucine-rich repeat domain-containing protein [Prevotella sp.]